MALTLGFGVLYTVRVTQARNKARLEAAKSEQVIEFLTGLFKANAPGQTSANVAANMISIPAQPFSHQFQVLTTGHFGEVPFSTSTLPVCHSDESSRRDLSKVDPFS